MTRILVFSGSIRPGSLNIRLARLAASRLRARGAAVTEISLADYPLPFVDARNYQEVAEPAKALRALIDSQAGLFIACPEYNAGFPALLKNALDWISVAKTGASGLAGKVVGLGSASPSLRGGYRALTAFRSALELGFGALVVPEMASIPEAGKVLSEDGHLGDDKLSALLDATLDRLVREAAHVKL